MNVNCSELLHRKSGRVYSKGSIYKKWNTLIWSNNFIYCKNTVVLTKNDCQYQSNKLVTQLPLVILSWITCLASSEWAISSKSHEICGALPVFTPRILTHSRLVVGCFNVYPDLVSSLRGFAFQVFSKAVESDWWWETRVLLYNRILN